jgi:signal transduction histidine kinase
MDESRFFRFLRDKKATRSNLGAFAPTRRSLLRGSTNIRFREWIPRQSLLLLLAAGLIIPAIVAFAVGFSISQDERRRDVEHDALVTARQILDLTDAEIEADLRTLGVLAASRTVAAREWHSFDRLMGVVMKASPSWTALTIRDRNSGEVIHETMAHASGKPLLALPQKLTSRGYAEGIYRDGRYCPCVVLHTLAENQPDVVLSLYIAPQRFQNILLERINPGIVAAVVDREGDFVARSLSYADRVGTPATIYVRRAVTQGGEGFYEGTTYEGLVNYTAYATSLKTGWSAHVAMDRSSIEGPRGRSRTGIVIALAAGLALAVALLAFAANDAIVKRREHAKLLDLQRAEAISRFTGIIVHDFRNILAVIWSGTRLILKQTQEPRTEEFAKAMQEALGRGERLVSQLLSFARGGDAETAAVDLEQLIEDSDELIRRSLGAEVEFEWNVSPDARYVIANRDQLELALINLARNTGEAIQGPGRFRIATEREGDMVAISVTDTGPGVPPELREQVFEPFFTTKSDSDGTGLGLAQVAGAVRQVDGHLEVSDCEGGGACFRLVLPRAR